MSPTHRLGVDGGAHGVRPAAQRLAVGLGAWLARGSQRLVHLGGQGGRGGRLGAGHARRRRHRPPAPLRRRQAAGQPAGGREQAHDQAAAPGAPWAARAATPRPHLVVGGAARAGRPPPTARTPIAAWLAAAIMCETAERVGRPPRASSGSTSAPVIVCLAALAPASPRAAATKSRSIDRTDGHLASVASLPRFCATKVWQGQPTWQRIESLGAPRLLHRACNPIETWATSRGGVCSSRPCWWQGPLAGSPSWRSQAVVARPGGPRG